MAGKDQTERRDGLSLDGQVAIVTGGGGGIGRAAALALASAGADCAIVDIVPERCEETAARVIELGRRALALPTDASDTQQLRDAVERTWNAFGRIDILVNNAGGVRGKAFIEQSERSWRRHIDLNMVSMLAATAAAAPRMIEGGRGGAIINVASIEASRAAPGYAVYAACKAGMLNFTRSLAVELSEHGIRVNAIAPDYTITPGLRGNISGPVDPSSWVEPSPEVEARNLARIPLGRAGSAEECGDVVLFLASAMSDYVTGTVIPVDGGTWASGGWLRNADGNWTLTGGDT
ncbi:MAG: SDR family oxidoreductase [Halioglobus sp.]|nr:SDR family oxidoreductase [Halioglobus sp.]